MAEDQVFDYLKKMNRPYSANDIQSNMKDYGKTIIVKALDSLVSQNKVIEKVYGKQKIYFINQDSYDDCNDDQIKEIEEKVKSLHPECDRLQIDFKMKEAQRNRLKDLLPMEEIEAKIAALTEAIKNLQEVIGAKTEVTINPEEFKKVKDDHLKITKELKRRKRIVKEAIDLLMENYQGKKQDLLEELDIEL